MGNRWGAALAVCLVLMAGRSARADDQADMKKLLAQAIKAAGGEEKLGKYRAATMKFKGKAYVTGTEIPFTAEWSLQYPNQHKMTVNADVGGMTFTQVTVINKEKGWIKEGGDTRALDKDALKEKKEQLYVLSVIALVPLKDKSFKLAPVGEVKIGDKDAVGMKVACKGHRDVNLYFDKKSNQLIKTETTVKEMDTDKEVTEETTYSNFKKVDGITYATKLKIKRDGKKYATVDEVTDYKLEEKLDDSEFAKP